MSEKIGRYRVGKVTNQQELCLQTNKEFLMDEMEGKIIVDKLFSNNILSVQDKAEIVGTEGSRITPRELNGKLVDKLMMRGPRGFKFFLKALKETGHKAAFTKLSDGSPDNGDDHSSEDEAENDDAEDSVLGRVENLASDVSDIKNRMDVLSLRLTRVDSGRQREIDRLRQELHNARVEIVKLHKENEALSALVDKRSKELNSAKQKILELEAKITDMEVENEIIQKKFKQQSKRLENLQTNVKQSNTKINALESSLEDQKSDHVREMESVQVKLKKEQEKMKAMEHNLKEHKKENEAAMADMEVKFSQLMDQKFQDLANNTKNEGPKNTGRLPARSSRQRAMFPDINKSKKTRPK